MNIFANCMGWRALLAAAIFLAAALPSRPAAAAEALTQPQLEQLAAPIALYPDDLVAEVLDAATHPADVAAAERWRVTTGAALSPDQLAAATRAQPWPDSVKALVPLPEILGMMVRDPNWAAQLGRAHAGQDAQLLAAIQDLRRRAQAADTLASVPQQQVTDDGQVISIEPAQADAYAVPYYDPEYVYGTWPWSDYPPYVFEPPFYEAGFWGPTIFFGTAVFVGPHHHHHHIQWNHQQASVGSTVMTPTARVTVAPRVSAGATVSAAAPAADPSRHDWIANQRAWLAREAERHGTVVSPASPPPVPAAAGQSPFHDVPAIRFQVPHTDIPVPRTNLPLSRTAIPPPRIDYPAPATSFAAPPHAFTAPVFHGGGEFHGGGFGGFHGGGFGDGGHGGRR